MRKGKEYAVAKKSFDKRAKDKEVLDQFHSVEISLDGLDLPYQFKIWNIKPMPMCILVRDDSNILSQIKVGDILNMKYNNNRNSGDS